MEFDLDRLSLQELKDLQGRVARAISGYEDRRKREALAELDKKALELGYSLSELIASQGTRKLVRKRAPAGAKYANPANPADTWSGRGRKPKWFVEALERGKSPEDLAV